MAQVARDSVPAPAGFNVFDAASGLGLHVITREEWEADETIRFHDDGSERWAEMFVPPRLIAVHHTATSNAYEDVVASMAEIRSIYSFHTLGRDWGDIGYHAVIDRFGNIFEGRHGRGGDPQDGGADREILSHAVTGGHTTYYEYGTVGVALLGDATADDWPLTGPEGPMWDALVRYCTFEAARSGIVPLAGDPDALEEATADFLRSDEIWHEGVPVVCGHRHIQETTCPGDAVLELLPALRAAVTAGLARLRQPGIAFEAAPDQRIVEAGTVLQCRVSELPAAGRLLGLEFCAEGWFKPVDSEDIDYFSGYTSERQPRIAWEPLGPSRTVRLDARRPGHYAVHVRAVLQAGSEVLRSADRASFTVLVPDPAAAAADLSMAEEVGD